MKQFLPTYVWRLLGEFLVCCRIHIFCTTLYPSFFYPLPTSWKMTKGSAPYSNKFIFRQVFFGDLICDSKALEATFDLKTMSGKTLTHCVSCSIKLWLVCSSDKHNLSRNLITTRRIKLTVLLTASIHKIVNPLLAWRHSWMFPN